MRSWGDTWTTPAPQWRRSIALGQAAALGLAVIFASSTVVRRTGFQPLLDGWLQALAYAGLAAMALARPLLSARGRVVWLFVAGGIAARAAGFALYLGVVRNLDPVPYPSVADVAWLLSAALLMAGLITFARSRFTLLPVTLVLDGVVGACAVGSLALVTLLPSVQRLDAAASPSAVVVNALYPAADVALLLAVLGMLVAYQWRPTPAIWIFGASVVGFAVVDSVYLYLLSLGEFRPGTPLSGLSMLATAGMALSAWAPRGQPARSPHSYLPGLIIPATLTTACLGLLLYATFRDVSAAAVLLAAAGVAVSVVRTSLAFASLRQLSRVRAEARTDDLTGLPNRRAFNEAVGRALRQRSRRDPFALLVLDLDDFKEINDTLGHHRGDELLNLLAPRLQLTCGPQDVVARIGGDEFGVLLQSAGAAAAEGLAERLRLVCRGPFSIAGRTLNVGASVGIAVFPDDGEDAASLLQHADIAMYAAKGERSGHSFYRPEYHQATSKRLEAVEEIRAAISAGQFVLHYQPKVALADGTVVGVEALVRWEHPTHGLLAPYKFLPQVERGGLMRDLTVSLLDQALGQWKAWSRAGRPTTVAVNLSVSDLLDPLLPRRVERTLERHGAPGSALILELTEDLLLADPTRGQSVVESLSSIGVRVQVDDYGTGFSTLGYLRDLPTLDGLKLDRSFVTHIADDPRAEAIVASTIALADDLGLELVAEGVETEEARSRLVGLGCPHAQGYLFGRPSPADDVPFDAFVPRAGSPTPPKQPAPRDERPQPITVAAPARARPPMPATRRATSDRHPPQPPPRPRPRRLTVTRATSLALLLTVLAFTTAAVLVVVRNDVTSERAVHGELVAKEYDDLEVALLRQEVARHDLLFERGSTAEVLVLQRRVDAIWQRIQRLEGEATADAAHHRERQALARRLTEYQQAVTALVRAIMRGQPVEDIEVSTDRIATSLADQLAQESSAHRADADAAFDELRARQRLAAQLFPVLGALSLILVGACIRLLSGQRRRLSRMREEAQVKAVTDALTGLANRAGLLGALKPASSGAAAEHPAALILLDLDGFKAVNDTYGHELGDEVLKVVASRLRETAPEGSLIARLGGDEFVVVLPDAWEHTARQVAEEIHVALSAPTIVRSVLADVGASIGVALTNASDEPGHETASSLLRRADIAMYAAKTARSGPVVFADLMDGTMAEGRGRS